MKGYPKYLACSILGLALLAGMGCDSAPDPVVLEPYETILKERMAMREEIIVILDSIVDETSADDAIDPVLDIRARQKSKRQEKEALGPTPNDVKRYLWDKYSKQQSDLKNQEDAAAQRASTIPGSTNFFQEVLFFKFKMIPKRR